MTEPQTLPASNAEALLDTANSASQHVALLHVAFMVLCAYIFCEENNRRRFGFAGRFAALLDK